MRGNLWLTFALVLGIVGFVGGETVAQTPLVTVNANFARPGAPFPDTARPSGSVSVAAAMPQPAWRVVCDYGTYPGGTWTAWPQGPAEVATAVNVPMNGGPVTWQQPGSVPIINPPANLYVRARLQKQVGGVWMTETTAYNTCP